MLRLFSLCILLSIALACPGENLCFRCDKINDKNFCRRCAYSLYSEEQNKCIEEITAIPYCFEYTGALDSPVCKNCEMGYNLNTDGECVPCKVSGCVMCLNSVDVCDVCADKQTVIDGKCSHKAECKQKNCELCDGLNEFCMRCENGYAKNKQNKCVEAPRDCVSLEDDGKTCKECSYEFYIGEEGDCIPSNIKLKKSWWFLYFIIIIFIVAVALGCFYWYKQRNQEQDAYEGYIQA